MSELACILEKLKMKAKEMIIPGRERFYPPDHLTWFNPSKELLLQCTSEIAKLRRELATLSSVFDVEGRDTWSTFLDVYVNAYADPIEERDFKEAIAHLRRLIQLSEAEAKERWVYELKTKSGFKIYLRVRKDKLVVWGDTFNVRDTLKKLKLQWDPIEKVWYTSANAITIDTLKSALEPL